MKVNPQYLRVRFWLWVTIAFALGMIVGFIGCIVLLIILQAMIAYV